MRQLVIIFILFVSPELLAEDNNKQFLMDFIAGNYHLIGKALDSENTYYGTITFKKTGNNLAVVRTIANTVAYGDAAIEKALHGETNVLRIRFRETSIDYEETCLITGDLDNYARLSCYLYRPGEKTDDPGLETFFIKHE